MKRKDIQVGTVYGYYEGRLVSGEGYSRYPYVKPVVILDTTVSSVERERGGLYPAPGGRPMRRTGWNKPAAGFPAVILTDPVNADIAMRCWDRRDFVSGRNLTTENYGVIGRYTLVTYLPHLHGLYADLMEERWKRDAEEKEARIQQQKQRSERFQRYGELHARLAALGINIPETLGYSTASEVRLSFDQAETLIGFAENYRDHKLRGIPE